jgi:hypothetical protein
VAAFAVKGLSDYGTSEKDDAFHQGRSLPEVRVRELVC